MLEAQDIQGMLFSGYSKHPSAAYVFLTLRDAAAARAWIGEFRPRVTTGGHWDRDRETSLNVAFSYRGFARWGLDKAALDTFARPFIEGMSRPARAQMLGDDPDQWAWGKPDNNLDVLLMLFGHTPEALEAALARERHAASAAFDEVFTILSQTTPFAPGSSMNQEHFGFVDGLAQPDLAGYRPERHKANGPGNEIQPGEFVLGYGNEFEGQLTASPHVTDGRGILAGGDFGRNGSYLVIRQMEQDVAGFWTMVREQSKKPDGSPDPAAEEALAAKIIGRWRDGTPVTLSPEHDGLDPAQLNNFGFADQDQFGDACPFGAHIRRANPRDTLLDKPSESIVTLRRHRLLRRGRPYGPRIADRYTPDGQSRGLVFVTLNANIERQFEFVQHAWITQPNFAGLYDEADPLLGGRTEKAGSFSIPKCPVRTMRQGIVTHVNVRGGAYFFLPGVAALRYLSES